MILSICANPLGEYFCNVFRAAIDYVFVAIGNGPIVKMAEAVIGIDIY
jgi:hypothetical protein